MAPFSYSGAVAHDPMTLVVSCCRKPNGDMKEGTVSPRAHFQWLENVLHCELMGACHSVVQDTCANVLKTKEFVVNIMSEWCAEATNHTYPRIPSPAVPLSRCFETDARFRARAGADVVIFSSTKTRWSSPVSVFPERRQAPPGAAWRALRQSS